MSKPAPSKQQAAWNSPWLADHQKEILAKMNGHDTHQEHPAHELQQTNPRYNKRYVETNLPPYIYVRVRYFHEGNSTPQDRRAVALIEGGYSPRYVAECRLINTNQQTCIGYGVSACSPKDNPSRRIARAIAVGRAMKNSSELNYPYDRA